MYYKREHWLQKTELQKAGRHDDGQAYLIDFEQVQTLWLTSPIQTLTATPRYMAPELFLGHAKSKASDIYALGIVLYEWLNQQRLSACSYQQWYNLHQQGIEVKLSKQYQIFTPILKLMLAHQRPTSVYDVLESLDMVNI